jgi:hypothetical protein
VKGAKMKKSIYRILISLLFFVTIFLSVPERVLPVNTQQVNQYSYELTYIRVYHDGLWWIQVWNNDSLIGEFIDLNQD